MAKRGPKPYQGRASTEESYATNYVQERVKCGKPNCKTCQEGDGHGPYWYSYHYSPTIKRYVKKYIGKSLPQPIEKS
jgi:hypothetical protein